MQMIFLKVRRQAPATAKELLNSEQNFPLPVLIELLCHIEEIGQAKYWCTGHYFSDLCNLLSIGLNTHELK